VKRADKSAIVESLNKDFSGVQHVILASFRGLTVNQANDLRRRVSGVGGTYRVIKNRLARRAAAGTPIEPMSQGFAGPCAIATHDDDPVVLAKTLAEFAKTNPQIELIAGLVDARETIDAAGVEHLSTLPGLSELRAQLLALVQTPATTLVRLFNTPGSQLARVVDARRESHSGDAAP
jgi:large subunit ribosomal protein L10